MFGLERENTDVVDFSYDLENDMKNPEKNKIFEKNSKLALKQ